MLNQVWYHQPKGGYGPQAVQHSPGLLIYTQGGENGRSAGSGCWDGAIKTIFWIDPVAGIAVCHLVLGFNQEDLLKSYRPSATRK